MRRLALTLCLTASAVLASGCDALGIESASQVAAKKDVESHAIGSACRHAVRSIEDCFKGNPKAGKAAVFAGWKEMDQYMRDNQIVGMPSTETKPAPPEAAADDAEAKEDADHPDDAAHGKAAKTHKS